VGVSSEVSIIDASVIEAMHEPVFATIIALKDISLNMLASRLMGNILTSSKNSLINGL
jgi:hypothetical protein